MAGPHPDIATRLGVATAFEFTRRIAGPAADTPAFAFAGIARPDRFFSDLEAFGWRLTGRKSFADHHHYSARDVEQIRQQARESGAPVILTTEKDAVRLTQLDGDPAIVAIPLEIEIDRRFRDMVDGAAADYPRRRMRHRLEYLIVTVVSFCVRPLSLSLVRRLGEGLGLMFYAVDRVHRRIAMANLDVAFPNRPSSERRAIARSMFKHFGRLLLELLKFASLLAARPAWVGGVGR